jgi:arylsulfatase A-like enzyme
VTKGAERGGATLRLLAAGLALAVAACGSGEEASQRRAPRIRLVELPRSVEPLACCEVARADAVAPPLAQIGDEGRPVLRAFPEVWLGRTVAELVAGSDRAAAWLPLPASLRDATRLRVRPEVARPDGKGWTAQPARLLEVGIREGVPALRVEVALPEGAARREVWVRAYGRVPPRETSERIASAPCEVPPHATLEWGIGLLPESTLDGEARFSVAACRGDDCAPLSEATLAAGGVAAWHDQQVSLAAFAGRRVSFRFESSWSGEASAGNVAFPVWSDPSIVAPDPAPAGPSLLLLSLDTLRADRLPAYGYPLDTAPFLSGRFAAEGTLFERAVTSADMTGPSHLTLFTALQPSVHGLRSNVRPERLPATVQTLASVLRDHGFTTGAITDDGALAFGRGIERGFGRYREHRHAKRSGGLVDTTLSEGRAWLDRHDDRRFFLFLHSYEVHTPYVPLDRYPALGYATPAIRRRWQGRRIRPEWDPQNYDREIQHADDAVRGFLEALDREGRLDDVLVVVLSDHGEAFLERGALHHAGVLDESVLRVPLMLRGPGVARGRRVAAPVGLIDVMPTLLDLLGIPAPEHVGGRSFADLARGEDPGEARPPRPLFSESWSKHRTEWRGGGYQSVAVQTPSLAVRIGSHKLVRDRRDGRTRDRFFEVEPHPDQPIDLSASDPAAAARLRALADGYSGAMQAQREALSAADTDDSIPLDAESEDALRALGYLD